MQMSNHSMNWADQKSKSKLWVLRKMGNANVLTFIFYELSLKFSSIFIKNDLGQICKFPALEEHHIISAKVVIYNLEGSSPS